MRLALCSLLVVLALPLAASAQDAPVSNTGGGALDPESYVALSADQRAQLSLAGFRSYLERIRPTDAALYGVLDPRLEELETRETAADVVFGLSGGLSVAALVAAIPVYTQVQSADGETAAIGLVIGGLSTFVLGLVIQAFLRPNHDDLMRLIDLHDATLGRR